MPRRLLVAALFAAAMGYLEAVVVVYIRGLLGMGPGDGMPAESEVMRRMAALPWLLYTEQAREVATMMMIASVAWLAAPTLRARIGAFLVVFGVWDIVYYIGLYAHLRWPTSLATKDLLFLIPPGPWWYQPVWVPLAFSVGFIVVGSRMFLRGTTGSRTS